MTRIDSIAERLAKKATKLMTEAERLSTVDTTQTTINMGAAVALVHMADCLRDEQREAEKTH